MSRISERLTDRITRARLELEFRRSLRPLAVIAAGLVVGVACWGFILVNVADFEDARELRFEVDDATAVVAGRHEVRIKGVPAGTITDVELDDGQAVLTATVAEKYGPIYRNARAQLRPNTALQDMFLDIVDRGTERAGRASADQPIPATQTDTSVNVADVLQVFDPEHRAHMAGLLRDLGAGLEDRGDDLAAVFAEALPFVRVGADLAEELGRREHATKRLVTNVAALTGELARRSRQVRVLAREGGTTLRALGDHADDVGAMIDEFPRTIDAVESSFGALRGALPDVDRAVRDLRPAAARLPEGLEALRDLSATAAPAVQALRPPVRRLAPLSDDLAPLATHLRSAVSRLRGQAGAVDHVTKTLDACELAVYGFFQWTASVLKMEDARGVTVRGDFTVDMNSPSPTRVPDPNVFAGKSCAPGRPKGATP